VIPVSQSLLSQQTPQCWSIGKVPPIPKFVLPSSAVSCKPYVLLMTHGQRCHTIGIFPDERSAIERRKQLIEERNNELKGKTLFLSGTWKNDRDYVIKPLAEIGESF
jgi:hypothetical protein